MDNAIHWVMGRPEVFLVTPGDMGILPMVLDAANRYESRPSEESMDALIDEYRMTSIFGI
ncbi:MAG: hypothetical protein AAF639_03410 [Chloroflexota bacterium]